MLKHCHRPFFLTILRKIICSDTLTKDLESLRSSNPHSHVRTGLEPNNRLAKLLYKLTHQERAIVHLEATLGENIQHRSLLSTHPTQHLWTNPLTSVTAKKAPCYRLSLCIVMSMIYISLKQRLTPRTGSKRVVPDLGKKGPTTLLRLLNHNTYATVVSNVRFLKQHSHERYVAVRIPLWMPRTVTKLFPS